MTNARDDRGGSPANPAGALELAHHHPGRLRVRAECFRDATGLAEEVREVTLGIPGVTGFAHNQRTGSILIEYLPGLAEPDAILVQVAEAAGVARFPDGDLARLRPPALVAVGAVQELNALASELTGHRADLRSLIPAGLAALGAYSFVASGQPRMPRWDNLLWWSYSVFVGHHQEEIARASTARRLAHAGQEGGAPTDARYGLPGPRTGLTET